MTDLNVLKVGGRYRVAKIAGDDYVVIVGFEGSPTGGIYWTEFERAT